MLWVALHFPQLRRQALSRGHAPPEPEREALAAVAAWACQFTPRVSLEPPQALLMEVEGSLRYFGGRWKFLARLRAGLTPPRLRSAASRKRRRRAPRSGWRAAMAARLEALPVAVTGLAPEALALLANLGIRTVGGLLRLPREGLARRFGPGPARGDRPGLRHGRPSRANSSCRRRASAARLELPAPVMQAENALFAARRLLAQMEGFLAARQAGVRRFSLGLLHDDAAGDAK